MKPDLSICIPCYNRSRIPWSGGVLELFHQCVRSIRQAALDANLRVELIVADFCSTDWPPIEWIEQAFAPFPARVVATNNIFTIGYGKNLAAEFAQADVLFFCETDMIVPPHVLTAGLQTAREGFGYFPIYRRFHGPETQETYWGDGHGCCVVLRGHWRVNRWIERVGWGSGEDDHFAHWFIVRELEAREKVEGFCHLWHPITESKREVEIEAGQ